MEPQTPLVLPPEHKNNRKFIIIVASVFVLMGIAASLTYFLKDQLGYYPEVIQNQKNTSNEWKTYRNEEYGFEYPNTWDDANHSYGNDIFQLISNNAKYNFFIYDKDSFGNPDGNSDCYSKIDNLFINKIKWSMYSEKCGEDGDAISAFTYNGNSTYRILIEPKTTQMQYLPELKSILSTFKFLNSTTTDISNWKTYRNEKYGFEFKHPQGFTKNKEINGLMSFVSFDNFNHQYIHGGFLPENGLEIMVAVGSARTSIDDIINLEFRNADKIDTDIEVDGVKGSFVKSKGDKYVPVSIYKVYVIKDDHLFQIGVSVPEFADKTDQEFNKIISTFKFLNSTTTDISNWKTYRNEEYGFEFKYPSDPENNGSYLKEMNIRFLENKQKIPLADWIEENEEFYDHGGVTKVYGRDDALMVNMISDGGVGKTVYFANEDKIIALDLFVFYKNGEKLEKYLPIFNKILSTFKFNK